MAAALAAGLLSGVLTFAHAGAVVVFAVSAVALAALAALVGQATEQLGEWLGPGATGVVQSALGNLPELFVGIFALRAGLVGVVQAAIVGSILANGLLVLGLAFLIGGLRNGRQRFSSEPPRITATLMVLAVSALAVPTLTHALHTPAAGHEGGLSVACALVLLAVFVASVPFSLGGGSGEAGDDAAGDGGARAGGGWPLWLTVAVLGLAGLGAAFVSDWFVGALRPAARALRLSEAFTGFVLVAIAGNAVENVVGVRLAARDRADYAVSVILNSSLQVALCLTPVLVLLSLVVGGAHLTLVLPPLLVAALGLATAVSTLIVYDGESVWLEGVALIGLYGMIAASFWWG